MSQDSTSPRDPFLGNHYVRNPQHAEEIRRLEIGRTLEMSRYGDLPLTATARLEALKLVGGSGMLVDDEIPTQALLELYIQYVVPHLPRTSTDMVDDSVAESGLRAWRARPTRGKGQHVVLSLP